MSTYVISDIHGCYTAFMRMLEQIKFSEDDKLYIAGDIIDRGGENLETLQWLMKKPENIEIIMGNHDEAFVEDIAMLSEASKCNYRLKDAYREVRWSDSSFDYYETIDRLIKKYNIRIGQFCEWARKMKEFPYYKEICVNGKDYVIVHAAYLPEDKIDGVRALGYNSAEQFYTCARANGIRYGGKENATIIFGHTPTLFEEEMVYNSGRVWHSYREDINCHYYDIDCGYVYKKYFPVGRMACMRLDDEQIFYLDEE